MKKGFGLVSILIIVGIIAVGGGGYYYFTNTTNIKINIEKEKAFELCLTKKDTVKDLCFKSVARDFNDPIICNEISSENMNVECKIYTDSYSDENLKDALLKPAIDTNAKAHGLIYLIGDSCENADFLEVLLQEENSIVRLKASQKLYDNNCNMSLDNLKKIILSETDKYTKVSMINYLARLGGKDILGFLEIQYSQEEDQWVKGILENVIYSLKTIGEYEIIISNINCDDRKIDILNKGKEIGGIEIGGEGYIIGGDWTSKKICSGCQTTIQFSLPGNPPNWFYKTNVFLIQPVGNVQATANRIDNPCKK